MRMGDISVIPDGDGDPDVEGAAEERESEPTILILILCVDIAVVEPGVDRGRHEHPLAVGHHGSLWGGKVIMSLVMYRIGLHTRLMITSLVSEMSNFEDASGTGTTL